MTIFLDTANLAEIQNYKRWGILQGVTTNQRIWLQEKGINFKSRLQEIINEISPYPVSVELTKTDSSNNILLDEAKEYSSLGKNVVIKVPMWGSGRGLSLANLLINNGISVNITCCMSLHQGILVCELGATYVSYFYNRTIDFLSKKFTKNGAREIADTVIQETRKLIDREGFDTKIIVGSIREPEDVTNAFIAGAHIVTITPKVLEQLPYHPKTEETILEFDSCWKQFMETK